MAERPIEPRDLSGVAALMACMTTPLARKPREKDTEYVKRIVCAYLNAHREVSSYDGPVATALALLNKMETEDE